MNAMVTNIVEFTSVAVALRSVCTCSSVGKYMEPPRGTRKLPMETMNVAKFF